MTRLLHMTTVPVTLNFLVRQIAHAQRHGFDVHAITSPGESLDAIAQRTGIAVHELPMARRITPFKDLVALSRLTRMLRRLRPDIVHGHTPKGGLLAMMASWCCGVPVRVYHMHGLPMVTATGLKRALLRWSEKVSCRLASQVYCVSPSVRDVAVAEGLCDPTKITVLHNGTVEGIDAEHTFNPESVGPGQGIATRSKLGIPPSAPVLGFVGRIVRDKGMIELAQAWRKLREEFADLHLLLIGPFEPQDPVPTDVEHLLRNDERIHLTDHIDPRAMPRYYSALDLLVLPTYREGFNTAILEAAAMEIPAVASRVPGCVEGIVDGETGALVPPRDAERLTNAVRLYLRDAELRRRHGQAARARVLRDFRPADLCEAMLGEYRRLLQQARGATAVRREMCPTV